MRELVYNIADAVNKVGPALVIYIAATRTRREESDATAFVEQEEMPLAEV